jgi:hypothetical protein
MKSIRRNEAAWEDFTKAEECIKVRKHYIINNTLPASFFNLYLCVVVG